MKKYILLLAVVLGFSHDLLAKDLNAICVANEEDLKNGGLIESELVSLKVVGNQISVTSLDCVENEVAGGCHFTGDFVKTTKKQSDMYSSYDLLDTADQTDYGYIFLSKSLAAGQKGEMTLSVRQLGDSEGAWWINQRYNCVSKIQIPQ